MAGSREQRRRHIHERIDHISRRPYQASRRRRRLRDGTVEWRIPVDRRDKADKSCRTDYPSNWRDTDRIFVHRNLRGIRTDRQTRYIESRVSRLDHNCKPRNLHLRRFSSGQLRSDRTTDPLRLAGTGIVRSVGYRRMALLKRNRCPRGYKRTVYIAGRGHRRRNLSGRPHS